MKFGSAAKVKPILYMYIVILTSLRKYAGIAARLSIGCVDIIVLRWKTGRTGSLRVERRPFEAHSRETISQSSCHVAIWEDTGQQLRRISRVHNDNNVEGNAFSLAIRSRYYPLLAVMVRYPAHILRRRVY